MTARRWIGLALAAALVSAATAEASPPAAGIGIAVDRAHVSVRLGERFGFRTAIDNHGARPVSGLVAHLNVVSLRPGVYVDPEDWSSERTRYLPALRPGASTMASWAVKAVNSGDFAVYVVVVPSRGAIASGDRRLAVSRPVAAYVTEHRTLNSGGILPLALGVPGLLGALTVVTRLRRRRS
jgi:hypothetical protein